MADTEIHGLSYEIVDETSSTAGKGVKKLTDSLKKLKAVTEKGLGLNESARELKEFNDAVGDIDSSGITGMAQAIQTIGDSARRLSTVRGHLQAISELNFSNVTEAAEAITNIAHASGMGRQNNQPHVDEAVDGGAEVEHVDSQLDSAISRGSLLRELLSQIGVGFRGMGQMALSALGTVTRLFGRGAVQVGRFSGALMAMPVRSLTRSFRDTIKPIKQFTNSLGRIALYRAVRAAIAAITKALKEGIGYLNLYSKAMGTQFHQSLNAIATDALWLKGAFATVAEPLVNMVAPIIDAISEKVAYLCSLVAQLFSVLGGKSTYTKAIKTQTEYTDSISKAAEKTKSFLADFDELNVFDDSKNKGDELPDWGHMFEEVPIDIQFKDFGEKIRELIKEERWRDIGEYLGDIVNDWFRLPNVDWENLGRDLGKKINAVIQMAYGFLKRTDFRKIGNRIAEFLNGMIAEIDFNTAGRLWTRKWTALFDLLIGIIEGLDWKLIGKSIKDFYVGLFDEATEWLESYDWGKMAKGLWKRIKDFFEGLDVKQITKSMSHFLATLLKSIADAISALDWSDVGYTIIHEIAEALKGVEVKELIGALAYLAAAIIVNIPSLIVGALAGVVEIIANFFEEIGADAIAGFFKGIVDALRNVGKWLKENVVDPVVKWVKDLFGIHSPSTVFAEIGGFIVEGFYQGIKNKINSGMETIKGWAKSVINWFNGGDGNGTIIDKFKNFAVNIVNGFKDRVATTYTNVKSSITTWATSVKNWFTQAGFGGVNATTFGQYAIDVLNGFKNKVSSTYTTVKTSITTWAQGVKDWFTGSGFGAINTNTFSTYANNIIEGFKNKVSSAYSTVQSAITTWATSVKTWFSNNVNRTTWEGYAETIISGFKSKISSTYSTVQSSITTWATSVKTWFTNTVSSSAWGSIASNIITGFKNGISASYTNAKSAMETWGSSVKTWFTNYVSQSSFYQIASDVVTGFKNGIGALYNTCKNNIESWGASIISWFKAKLDSHSPSKVFETIGEDTVLGFNLGIKALANTTSGVIGNWADSFTKFSPQMAFAVDTSALRYYDTDSFAKTISPNVSSANTFTATGFQEAMTEFYQEYVAPIMGQMADDVRRQADKKEQTIVQVGNRTVTDAVTIQKNANGFEFTKS